MVTFGSRGVLVVLTVCFAFASLTASKTDGTSAAAGLGRQSTVIERRFPVRAPGIVRDVMATAGDGIAIVSWDPPLDSIVTSYRVSASPGTFRVSPDGDEHRATVSGLHNGTTYSFQVRALNVVGEGPPSRPSNRVKPAAFNRVGELAVSTVSAGDMALAGAGGLLAICAVGAAIVRTRRRSRPGAESG